VALQGEFVKLLNGKHTDGETISTIDRLNEVIKDPKWLEANKDAVTMFGPRIPNDATNTIEAATVWHFLPEAFGNSIIVPTEIVAKAGSDFDGDKLFMTFPNIDREGKVVSKGVDNFETLLKETQALEKAKKSIKGRPSSRALIAEQKKYLQNRFKNAAVEILMLPENYAYLTKPNGTYLVDTYVPELEENKTGYNRYDNTHGQAPKLSAADKNGKRKTVISPTRVLEATYNLYKHDANLSLEASLGIMAKLTKSHPIYKSVGAIMPATYKASAFIEALNKTIETGYTLPVVMRFAHNKTRNAQGQEVISLSGERTQRGSRISDVSSHSLQGILDRAKESFPFELKLVPEAMDVFSYMLQAGVDEEQIFFFLNQPLIAEYFEKEKLSKSAYSSIIGKKEKGSPANNIINNLLKNFYQADLTPLYDEINVAKLRYVLNGLKITGEDQKYYYKIKKVSGVKEITLKELLAKLNSGGLAPENIERISTMENMSNDSTVYFYSNAINSTENFAFATEVLSNKYLPKGNLATKTLKDGVKDNKSMTALALFMNYLELERQFKAMNDLQQTFSPDTGKLTTVQQVLKRMESYEELRKSNSIDQDFLNRLLKESILSSFNQDDLIKKLTEPLFNLRLNPEITKYISNAFVDQSKASKIRNNPTFGKGINGQERFSTLFNNAVINYIYQNYLSNFRNAKGELVNIPDTYTDNRPVIKVDELDTDVEIVEEGIAINTRRIETDYANKAYLETSTAENNYGSRGLDTFKIKDDPFQTLASYYRYVIARESNRVNHPIESLENNSDFLRRVLAMGNANDAYESYISERALGASFNNKYIMGKTKYSYSDSLLNLINEFGDTLKVNYPITAQLTPGTNTDGVKVLQLNNQKEAQGELASVYYNNLRNLADPSVTKVQNKNKSDEENESDNQRISEMFNLFSLNMFYQHGVGKTRLGFVKALDPVEYKDILTAGSKAFISNYLSTETLDEIFETVVSMDKFKNYLVSPEGYIHSDLATSEASKPSNDGTLETFDDEEGENIVLVRLINQEDVDLFNQMVKKLGGKRPERFFTSKTLFPAFYNSATGKRQGMPQSAIWIKNQYGTYDMLDQETGEYYYENVNLATGMHITKKEDVQPTEPTNQLPEYTNYSGGAIGSDTAWAEIGKEFGIGKQVDYKPQTLQKLTPEQIKEVEDAYQKAASDLGRKPLTYDWNNPNAKNAEGKSIYYSGGLVRRDYLQAKAADAVFAVGKILEEGDTNSKGYKVKALQVDGGTGYAVQMAINLGKPVYVFDLNYNVWMKYNPEGLVDSDIPGQKGRFDQTDTPVLTKKFAGVGTREINEAGKQAIRDVYKNTASQAPTQPSTQDFETIYSQLGNKTLSPNIVISNIKTKDGKYDRDANVKEAKDKGRVYTMEVDSDVKSFSNPWASFNRTGTIKTNSTKEAVLNYIDWLTTDKFINVKPERRAFILDILKSGKLKGRQLQYYAELGEPSHASALDYLINKYNWKQPSTEPSEAKVYTKPAEINNVKEIKTGLDYGSAVFTVGDSEFMITPKKDLDKNVAFNLYKYDTNSNLYKQVTNPETKRNLRRSEIDAFINENLPKEFVDFLINLYTAPKPKITDFQIIDNYIWQSPYRTIDYKDTANAPILLTIDEVNKIYNETYSEELKSGVEKYLKPFAKDELVKEISRQKEQLQIGADKYGNPDTIRRSKLYINDLETALKRFTQPSTQPGEVTTSIPKEEFEKNLQQLLNNSLEELKKVNKDGEKYILGFHGGQKFDKPNRSKQYTGEFRNENARRIAESMGARYEGQMLFYTNEEGDDLFDYNRAIKEASYYAINYGENNPTVYAYLIPIEEADFTDRGSGEVGLSYDAIEKGNYIEVGRTGYQRFTQSTETSISPKPEATIDTDMNVYNDLVAKNNGVQPQTFTSENRMYRLNKFGNYDLVDATTGEIYLRNINMETGKQETEPGLDAPVDPEVIDKALDRLITLRATTNIEEQLAERGYDIVDIINNLAEAKTQEDYNKITKILDKLC
jgi:hypothetical protein